MLSLKNVSRRFGSNLAVADVSLDFEPGSFVGVIGRSGAGKSTLLRLINRLIDPSEGQIIAGGRDVTRYSGKDLRAWRTECAMVFQQFNLVGRLDVMTNVLVGRFNHAGLLRSLLGCWSEHDRATAISALEQFEMASHASNRAETLSGGQQQRVAIARALVQEPQIILADEPTASLDPRNAQAVMESLALINKRYGITVICNLHALELARQYCGRLVGMASGRVVFDGSPDELTDEAVTELYGMSKEQKSIPSSSTVPVWGGSWAAEPA